MDGVFDENITVALNVSGRVVHDGHIGGVIRKYDYVNVRFISLWGVARLCVDKGYLQGNYCYEQCKEHNITKIVAVRNDEDLLCLTNNLGSARKMNLCMDDDRE